MEKDDDDNDEEKYMISLDSRFIYGTPILISWNIVGKRCSGLLKTKGGRFF
jgi:hypothetical protein